MIGHLEKSSAQVCAMFYQPSNTIYESLYVEWVRMFHYLPHLGTNLDTKSGESVVLSDDTRHANIDAASDKVINNSSMIENIYTEENDDAEEDDIENEDITENYGENVEVEANNNN